jgi:hypothetical protein
MAENPTQRRTALHSGAMTLGLMLLVAAAAGGDGWLFSVAALVVAGLAVGGLYLVFPHGPLFALGVANGLAVYMCLYVVIGRSAFPHAISWTLPFGFLMPVAAFVGTCWLKRGELVALASRGLDDADLTHLPRVMRWLLMCGMVGVLAMASPFNRQGPESQTMVLMIAMAAISAISVIAVRDVVRLLVDVAAILTMVTARIRFLVVPMATYVSLFTLLATSFGCLYRIADALSEGPLFQKLGHMGRLDFSEALHFSVVTLATVGYGDILPIDDGVRILATIEMVVGQLLLLFGFSEIMRSRKA